MDVSDVSAGQRLVAGAALAVLGAGLAQPSLGRLTQISAVATLLGVGLLGAAAEPPLTNALGADEWEELSSTMRIFALVVLMVVAVVLYFAITLAADVLASGL